MKPMMVISDIHSSNRWKKMVRERGDAGVIFLGDYFDLRMREGDRSIVEDQGRNFLEICAYARGNPGTTLLIGNHDEQYFPFSMLGSSDKDEIMGREYGRLLMDNSDILHMVHVDRESRIIYSHAGITSTFLSIAGEKLNIRAPEPEDIERLWREHPQMFDWSPYNPLTRTMMSSTNGDDPWQPPTWVRPGSMARDAFPGWTQVVGHNIVQKIAAMITDHGDPVVQTCTLDNHAFVMNDAMLAALRDAAEKASACDAGMRQGG